MNTLPELLDTVVRDNPQKAAIIEGGRKLTYLDLQQRVHSLAGRLSSLGVKQGDSVALLLPNGAEFVISFFAIARLGAIVVPLNSHYQQNELTYFIGDCKASTLITIKEFEDLCSRVLAGLGDRCNLLILEEAEAWKPPIPQGERNHFSGPVESNHASNDVIYQ